MKAEFREEYISALQLCISRDASNMFTVYAPKGEVEEEEE